MDHDLTSGGAGREAGDALQTALVAHFAAAQLGAQSFSYLYASMLPTGVLWIDSWHPVPNLLAWFASLAWAGCVGVGLTLAVASWKRARLAIESLPLAYRIADLQFAPEKSMPIASFVLLLLSLGISVVLGVNGLSPGLVRPPVLTVAGRGWMILVVGAMVNRWLERSF